MRAHLSEVTQSLLFREYLHGRATSFFEGRTAFSESINSANMSEGGFHEFDGRTSCSVSYAVSLIARPQLS